LGEVRAGNRDFRGGAIAPSWSQSSVAPAVNLKTGDAAASRRPQNLLLFLLDSIYTSSLQRYQGSLYEKVFHLGYFTHSWKEKMSIKKFIYEKMKQWDFNRHNADPLTGQKELPIFHVVSTLDVARLTPIPLMTVNNDGAIELDNSSTNPTQLAELAMLTSFRNNPLSDSCVAIQHAVIPRNATPRGASPQLLAIMNLDHMSLGFSKSGAQEKRSMPRVEIVDALIDSMLIQLKVLK
jgi:hypothetical protein